MQGRVEPWQPPDPFSAWSGRKAISVMFLSCGKKLSVVWRAEAGYIAIRFLVAILVARKNLVSAIRIRKHPSVH